MAVVIVAWSPLVESPGRRTTDRGFHFDHVGRAEVWLLGTWY